MTLTSHGISEFATGFFVVGPQLNRFLVMDNGLGCLSPSYKKIAKMHMDFDRIRS